MADFDTILAGFVGADVRKERPTREAARSGSGGEIGKRDFDSFVEREAGERFYETASRLTGAFLSSVESAIYDPADQEGTVEERIRRNTEQFVAALTAAVESMNGAGDTAKRAIRKDGTMVGTSRMTKRSDVVAEVERLAKERHPELASRSVRAARAKVWVEEPALRDRHAELPPEAPTESAPPARPVLKDAGALAKIDAEAAELRKARPELSEREARVEAAKLRPDLRDEYHRAFASR